MNAKPSRKERLEHMIEAIDRIFRFTDEMSYTQFAQDEMAQFAIIKNLEIIGEAAYHIPRAFRDQYENIEWRKIIAFRHILVHDYYKINTAIVWNTVENKLTDLKIEVEKLVEES